MNLEKFYTDMSLLRKTIQKHLTNHSPLNNAISSVRALQVTAVRTQSSVESAMINLPRLNFKGGNLSLFLHLNHLSCKYKYKVRKY